MASLLLDALCRGGSVAGEELGEIVRGGIRREAHCSCGQLGDSLISDGDIRIYPTLPLSGRQEALDGEAER